MSTIATNTTLPTTLTAPLTTTQTSTQSDTSFTDLLTEATTLKKPNTKEFMDATGVSFKDASSLLYGVIGSNEDTRDWNAILSSSDPLAKAKEETAKMYAQTSQPNSPEAQRAQEKREKSLSLIGAQPDFQNENFTVFFGDKPIQTSLYLSSADGTILRKLSGTQEQIDKTMDNFGLDTSLLTQTITQLQNQSDILPSWTHAYQTTAPTQEQTPPPSTLSTDEYLQVKVQEQAPAPQLSTTQTTPTLQTDSLMQKLLQML
jgi:hypothetical protein